MRESARSIDLGLGRTWKGQVVPQADMPLCATVRTIPVKLVGTPEARDAKPANAAVSGEPSCRTTRRYEPAQPSVQEALASVAAALPDSDFDLGRDDAFQQALAFARTIPALTPEELGLSSSGVRQVERMELWLEPRDRMAFAAPSGKHLSATARVSVGPLERAWRRLQELPAPLVIYAAATLSLLSAVALRLLTP